MKETATSFEIIASFPNLPSSNFLYRVIEYEDLPLMILGLGSSEKNSEVTLVKIDPIIEYLKAKKLFN